MKFLLVTTKNRSRTLGRLLTATKLGQYRYSTGGRRLFGTETRSHASAFTVLSPGAAKQWHGTPGFASVKPRPRQGPLPNQSAGIPGGMQTIGSGSPAGGVAALNHRLIAVKPPASCPKVQCPQVWRPGLAQIVCSHVRRAIILPVTIRQSSLRPSSLILTILGSNRATISTRSSCAAMTSRMFL
jgi:hypothetical protein